jgi:hypothetical protein
MTRAEVIHNDMSAGEAGPLQDFDVLPVRGFEGDFFFASCGVGPCGALTAYGHLLVILRLNLNKRLTVPHP